MGNTIKLKDDIIVGSNICEIDNDSMTCANDDGFVSYKFANDIKSKCNDVFVNSQNKFIYRKIWCYQNIIFMVDDSCCSKYVKILNDEYYLDKKYFDS